MQNKRQPASNFFIKPKLQWRLIIKMVVTALCATLIGILTLVLLYLFQYDSTIFYRVTTHGTASIGESSNIIAIILPSLLISGIINLAIAIALGLYASRKYAVPIYKLEKWAGLLLKGNFKAKLGFREKNEFDELCDLCNRLSEDVDSKFGEIAKIASSKTVAAADMARVLDILRTVRPAAEPVEIHTGFAPSDNPADTLTPSRDAKR